MQLIFVVNNSLPIHLDLLAIGVNMTLKCFLNDPFQLTRSIRQGCLLAPFLYLFVADNLGYLLENHKVKGLKLPALRLVLQTRSLMMTQTCI